MSTGVNCTNNIGRSAYNDNTDFTSLTNDAQRYGTHQFLPFKRIKKQIKSKVDLHYTFLNL